MLILEDIMAKVEARYREARPGRVLGVRSEQVKSLAAVLVDAINAELGVVPLVGAIITSDGREVGRLKCFAPSREVKP